MGIQNNPAIANTVNTVLRFVFPVIRENPEAYPEDTTIRREVKARLIRGEKIGIGYGIRL